MPLDRSDRVVTVGFTVLRYADEPDTAYVEHPPGGTNLQGAEVDEYLSVFERTRHLAWGRSESMAAVSAAVARL